MDLSTYRVLILLSVMFTVPGMILVWLFLREGVEMTEQGVGEHAAAKAASTAKSISGLLAGCRETTVKTVQIFAEPLAAAGVLPVSGFMTLVVGVRMIYYHLFYTFPKYGIRELGEGAPVGQLSGVLNEVMILVLVPICGVLTQKVSAYRMVTVGSLISALSVFFIALPAAWFKPLADGWLGDWVADQWLGVTGEVNPLYISIFLFIVLLSVGEALWSPRLYEYAAAIAPKGQ